MDDKKRLKLFNSYTGGGEKTLDEWKKIKHVHFSPSLRVNALNLSAIPDSATHLTLEIGMAKKVVPSKVELPNLTNINIEGGLWLNKGCELTNMPALISVELDTMVTSHFQIPSDIKVETLRLVGAVPAHKLGKLNLSHVRHLDITLDHSSESAKLVLPNVVSLYLNCWGERTNLALDCPEAKSISITSQGEVNLPFCSAPQLENLTWKTATGKPDPLLFAPLKTLCIEVDYDYEIFSLEHSKDTLKAIETTDNVRIPKNTTLPKLTEYYGGVLDYGIKLPSIIFFEGRVSDRALEGLGPKLSTLNITGSPNVNIDFAKFPKLKYLYVSADTIVAKNDGRKSKIEMEKVHMLGSHLSVEGMVEITKTKSIDLTFGLVTATANHALIFSNGEYAHFLGDEDACALIFENIKDLQKVGSDSTAIAATFK